MRIVLIRHFKVKHKFPYFCDSKNYDIEFLKYENADLISNYLATSSNHFSICYSSNSKRAKETAQKVFKKKIITTNELSEVPIKAIFSTKLKIPFILWNILNRIAWYLNSKNTPETKNQTKKRAIQFLSKLNRNEDKNILIVSHRFFLLTLQNELIKIGFKGKRMISPKNGKFYTFENKE